MSASKIIAPQLSSYKITLLVHADASIMLYGSAGEFQQVILNLLSNAKDAFLDKAIEQRILVVSAREENKVVILCIEDTAGGIDATLLEKIFEPYFTTKEHSGGTGIGLYMSSLIIQQTFQGSIEVENIVSDTGPSGARFILRLPKIF